MCSRSNIKYNFKQQKKKTTKSKADCCLLLANAGTDVQLNPVGILIMMEFIFRFLS